MLDFYGDKVARHFCVYWIIWRFMTLKILRPLNGSNIVDPSLNSNRCVLCVLCTMCIYTSVWESVRLRRWKLYTGLLRVCVSSQCRVGFNAGARCVHVLRLLCVNVLNNISNLWAKERQKMKEKSRVQMRWWMRIRSRIFSLSFTSLYTRKHNHWPVTDSSTAQHTVCFSLYQSVGGSKHCCIHWCVVFKQT